MNFFYAAKNIFSEVDTVSTGLGPRFNLDSCSGCHAQPSVGGSSPATNPQVQAATTQGATNTIPPFITASGPVREARFVKNPDGTPDGGVHSLFVITGRSDAPGCNIKQPNFAAALSANNVVFRIPTPTFGLGLVEAVPDSVLEAALAANGQQKQFLGISGSFNRSANDGTITRFGWKAQNKSLLIFSGEAYNVEMGVTNDAFPNERETNPGCQFNATPESTTFLTNPNPSAEPGIGLLAGHRQFHGIHAHAGAADSSLHVRRVDRYRRWDYVRRLGTTGLCQYRVSGVPHSKPEDREDRDDRPEQRHVPAVE